MRLIELTELDGGAIFVNPENISEVTRPRASLDDSAARAVVVMVNGSRHAVRQTMAEVRNLHYAVAG